MPPSLPTACLLLVRVAMEEIASAAAHSTSSSYEERGRERGGKKERAKVKDVTKRQLTHLC